ncbi:YfbM family protein [Myxococcota bacterium]|nr:YfbM family protein [Myxococcota bacterium]MBU1535444.1 YfbM family protein [Myxococcota bacterium]
MGMICSLQAVSDTNIQLILESPPLIWRLIAPDDPEAYLELMNGPERGLFARLFGNRKRVKAKDIPKLKRSKGEDALCDIDKAWHGIHYCLNGDDTGGEPPLDFLMEGGEFAGDVDVGYGPARLFDSATVKELNDIISKITPEKLHENFDPEAMEELEIYPAIWARDGEEAFEYLSTYLTELQSFIAACAKHHLGMAVYLG